MLAVYRELFDDTEFMYNFEKEYEKRKKKARNKVLYYMKQKVSGLALIGISILTPLLVDGDATVGVILVPVGLYLLCTRKQVINCRER